MNLVHNDVNARRNETTLFDLTLLVLFKNLVQVKAATVVRPHKSGLVGDFTRVGSKDALCPLLVLRSNVHKSNNGASLRQLNLVILFDLERTA